MAFLPFPNTLRFLTLSNEPQQVGLFSFDEITEVKALRAYFLDHLSSNPSAQIRFKLSFDESVDSYFEATEWITISDITQAANYWIGWVTFNFDKTAYLPASTPIYLFCETSGYTEGSGSYAGLCFDDIPDVNVKAASDSFGVAVQFIELSE